MYQLPEIYDLALHGVADRGVANKERIMLRAWGFGPVNLAPYFVTVGYRLPGAQGGTPAFDGLCWLGEFVIRPNEWVFVYTGPGTNRSSRTLRGDPLNVIHWNRREVVFTSDVMVPLLMKMGGVAVERSPEWMLEVRDEAQLGLFQGGALGDLSKKP